MSAGSASAAVERCSGPRSVQQGVTIYSCMNVGLTRGLAFTRVYYNINTVATYTICDEVNRDGATNQECVRYNIGPGNSKRDTIGAELGNPAGVQKWFSVSAIAGIFPVTSPNVYDT